MPKLKTGYIYKLLFWFVFIGGAKKKPTQKKDFRDEEKHILSIEMITKILKYSLWYEWGFFLPGQNHFTWESIFILAFN